MSYSIPIRKNFTAHQNTPSQYGSPEQLAVYNVLTKNSLVWLTIYILEQRAQHLLL